MTLISLEMELKNPPTNIHTNTAEKAATFNHVNNFENCPLRS